MPLSPTAIANLTRADAEFEQGARRAKLIQPHENYGYVVAHLRLRTGTICTSERVYRTRAEAIEARGEDDADFMFFGVTRVRTVFAQADRIAA